MRTLFLLLDGLLIYGIAYYFGGSSAAVLAFLFWHLGRGYHALFVLALLFLPLSNALADEWFCKDESAQRIANIVKTCGIGEGHYEAHARALALKHAKQEFERLCSISDDVKGTRSPWNPKEPLAIRRPKAIMLSIDLLSDLRSIDIKTAVTDPSNEVKAA